MSDASTAHGTEPAQPITTEPLFPSEGDFSTVVPLSQVGRAPFAAERSKDDGRPAEAAWAREDRRGSGIARRGARAGEEEETLVPAHAGRRRAARLGSRPGAGQRPWTVTAAAVLLSVLAGVAAGSYLVWSKRPVVSNAPPAAAEPASQEVAADIPPPAPAPAAPPAVEAEPIAPEPPAREAAAATEAKPERPAETTPRAGKSAPPAAEPATRAAAEPATRAAERPRARAERAAPDTTPAPRPARNDAPTRRAATTAVRRPTRPATAARRLPVSAPPPSSKPKTVIQWP